MNEIINDLYAATEKTIQTDCYPGYPTTRLIIENARELDDLTLPEGPWTARAIPYPNHAQQIALKNNGYELDSLGRPLHPWLRDMLSNPEVGVVTGTGEYWNWGPNKTADSVLLNTDPIPKVLLIKRGDTETWALPGGFLNEGEDPVEAARRELFEEAGVIIAPTDGTLVYDGVVADLRTTAHAWAETTAMLWYVDHTPKVYSNDDAIDAAWFSSDELPDKLHGSHRVLIEKALQSHTPRIVTHAIGIANGESYRQASGGHMAYHRVIATHKDGTESFVKSHNKHAFTDPVRESHSLLYLQKEKHLYDHLRSNDFAYIPDSVSLYDSNTLIMQALSESNDWQWRAPKEQLDEYIEHTFKAIDTLNDLPIPADFKDAAVSVTRTIVHEGWDSFTSESTADIAHRLSTWQSQLRPEFKTITTPFMNDTSAIEKYFRTAATPTDLYLCHHDMRQANIAWHPIHGARLVDWSWAGTGGKNSDTTMLLIDLHKSGHNVSPYMERFDNQHAASLIGFWLTHSLMPAQNGDTVRFHQLVSALSAYDLLAKDW